MSHTIIKRFEYEIPLFRSKFIGECDHMSLGHKPSSLEN